VGEEDVAQPGSAIQSARQFALERHAGQLYGDEPYEVHLAAVEEVLTDHGFCADHWRAAAWLHDVVEDTETTIAEIEDRFGELVASLVWAVTGIGPTRAARNEDICRKIAEHPRALAPLKLADRIANVEAAKDRPKHLARYRAEQEGFSAAIRDHVPRSMWDRLERGLAD